VSGRRVEVRRSRSHATRPQGATAAAGSPRWRRPWARPTGATATVTPRPRFRTWTAASLLSGASTGHPPGIRPARAAGDDTARSQVPAETLSPPEKGGRMETAYDGRAFSSSLLADSSLSASSIDGGRTGSGPHGSCLVHSWPVRAEVGVRVVVSPPVEDPREYGSLAAACRRVPLQEE
jgi:hypothetical protein